MAIQVVSSTDSTVAVPSKGVAEESKEETKSATDQESVETAEDSEASDTKNANPEDGEENSDADAQDEQDDESDESKEESKKTKRNGKKKKIDRMTKALAERDREIEYLKKLAFEKQSQGKSEGEIKDSSKKEQPAAMDGKPKAPRMGDFETYEAYETARDKYQEDLADWKVDQREKQREQKARAEKFEAEKKAFEKRLNDFKESHPDFDDVMEETEGIDVSADLQRAISDSEISFELMYELAKDTDELQRIASLGTYAAIKALGKFEDKLLARKSSDKSKEVKTSAAPAPISKPVGSKTAGSIKKSIYDPKLSQAEFEQLYREQTKKRA